MTYDAYETSVEDGDKAELFEFSGAGVLLRQTSASESVDLGGGEVYTPAAIERSDAEVSSDHNAAQGLELIVSKDHPIAVLYRNLVPYEPISLRVTATQLADPAEEVEGVWLGFVRASDVQGDQATIKCEPIPGSFAREGLRQAYERRCGYQLFGPGCLVNATTYTVSGTVSAVGSSTITASAFGGYADGWFTLGKAILDSDVRLITAHVGTTITLLLPFQDAAVGDSIEALPGCDRLRGTCDTKFSNLLNYPGCDWIPDKNPFQVGLDG